MSDITQSPPASSSSQASDVNWQAIESDSDFRELVRQKRNFILPAVVAFLVYYFGFLILVGYFPSAVEVKVIGNINLAYVLAISEFIMAWVITYLYTRRANLFDTLAKSIVVKFKGERE